MEKEKLTDVERLQLQVYDERRLRLQFQLQLVQEQIEATDREIQNSQNQIRLKYKLGMADDVNIVTGIIARAPKPPPTA
jgi:hypothetical protein